MNLDFYRGKKVLITGHTGFKGAWMCKVLLELGADVTGYSLMPPTFPNLYDICKIKDQINSFDGDVRNLDYLTDVITKVQPEIVIHMAAQPLVRESYKNPKYTYETNVMGTVNVCEAVRQNPCIKSFVNVTTDKVYLNRERSAGYKEDEELNGYDPYSNSKSCSELVTSAYINSFFNDMPVAVSTARSGNVIGGGDFAADRIIPDCVRAAKNHEDIIVRNPESTRPYQHVLEPVTAYLMIAMMAYENKEKYASSYNVGPDDSSCICTGEMADLFVKKWNSISGDNLKWINKSDGGPHEATFLKLDCTKLKKTFDWSPRWDIDTAVAKTVEWTYAYLNGDDCVKVLEDQIKEFLEL